MICELARYEARECGFGVGLLTCDDRYPPKMIPGCHVVVHTTARTDRDARLLLRAIGVPFQGKMVD